MMGALYNYYFQGNFLRFWQFNEYINEKVQSISTLFGTRVVRSETVVDDEYNYIRPYKKTIVPSGAFLSFSANPLRT